MWLRGASLQHEEEAGRTSSPQKGAAGEGWGDGCCSPDRLPNLVGPSPWPQAHSRLCPQQRQPSQGQWGLEAGKDRPLVLEQRPGLGGACPSLPCPHTRIPDLLQTTGNLFLPHGPLPALGRL